MKLEDDALLTRYLVNQLKPLTEAEPILLADYIVALLKNNRPKKDLQKLCIEQLFDFIGEGTKDFVLKLFNALEDGSVLACQDESRTISTNDLANADILQVHDSPSPPERNAASNIRLSTSDPEGTDEDDDDRNHKHRRHAVPCHSFDRDLEEEGIGGGRPYRKRNRSGEISHAFQETHRSAIPESRRGSVLSSIGLENVQRRGSRDEGYGMRVRGNQWGVRAGVRGLPSGVDANQWGGGGRVRGLSSGVDVPNFRCETQMGPPRVMGGNPGGRFRDAASGPRLYDSSDSKHSVVWATPSPPPKSLPLQSSWAPPYGHLTGVRNGQAVPLNAGFQGGRGGAPISVNVNLGLGRTVGRLRCPDFEELGYCLRGDLCPMEHGANRIVVEDVQSLSQFNLPVALPTSSTIGFRSGSVGVASSSPSILPLPTSHHGSEPDLYDPDQPLWNTHPPQASVGMRRFKSTPLRRVKSSPPPLTQGHNEQELESHVSDESDSEKHARVSGALSLGSQPLQSGLRIWDRIGPLEHISGDREEQMEKSLSVSGDGLPLKESPIIDPPIKNGSEVEDRSNHLNAHVSNHGGQAQCTVYVNCIPREENRKELLLGHFRKFGEIVDIRIPASGVGAFVQFAHREDAEMALTSPDAVMGNRFIRLAWAKRDSVPTNAEKGKPSLNTSGMQVSENVTKPAEATGNGPPSPFPQLPTVKKQVDLDHLKEELRQKQEDLARKRDEFRRKLDQLTKQAVPSKRQKSEDLHVSTKIENRITCIVDESESSISAKQPSSSGLTSPDLQPSPKTPSVPVQRPVITSGCLPHAQWGPARYKLDNRTPIFRIFPPFPDDIHDILALKEHFVRFGELLAVELEETIAGPISDTSRNTVAELREGSVVRVTFGSRRAAERAFLQGKCINGTSLQLAWYNTPSSLSSSSNGQPNLGKEGNAKEDNAKDIVEVKPVHDNAE